VEVSDVDVDHGTVVVAMLAVHGPLGLRGSDDPESSSWSYVAQASESRTVRSPTSMQEANVIGTRPTS
jgi:hypothetical protein